MADVQSADFETLLKWEASLGAPDTPVQEAVRRRIDRRIRAEMAGHLPPYILTQWRALLDKLQAI